MTQFRDLLFLRSSLLLLSCGSSDGSFFKDLFGGGSQNGGRNEGYGSSSEYRLAGRSRTSLLTVNNGGKYGGAYRSNSYNGFGMGLGAGLKYGYGMGLLSKPLGHSEENFGHDYIHKNRDYDQDKPYTCLMANVTEYIKRRSDLQELDIEESEHVCLSSDDLCFGKLTILAANFTLESGMQKLEGFKVTIEKGCRKSSSKLASEDRVYDDRRHCAVSTVSQRRHAGQPRNGTKTLAYLIGLAGRRVLRVEMSQQHELCTCEGSRCNRAVTVRTGWWAQGGLLILFISVKNVWK